MQSVGRVLYLLMKPKRLIKEIERNQKVKVLRRIPRKNSKAVKRKYAIQEKESDDEE
jgi:hypothetical protein